METLYQLSDNYLPSKHNIGNSLTPVLWKDETEYKVAMLEEVDVDIDGRAYGGQKTRQIARAFWNRNNPLVKVKTTPKVYTA